MKKIVKEERCFCDNCKKQCYPRICLGCGIEYCWDCAKKLGVKYPELVSFGGGREGYFCSKCNANVPEKVYKLHNAYKAIRSLSLERNAFYIDFDIRAKKAESALAEMLK